MRILFCCEFYAPSVGGIQEVMRQVAERLVSRGHEVTIATSRLPDRSCWSLNGVLIKDFSISGSTVAGLQGDVSEYQQWVLSKGFDLILINMAQQWTLDALIPVLKNIRSRKVLIPCGLSCLYEPSYSEYYRSMPDVLRQFNHVIFHASDYRDIRFAKRHGIKNMSIIPNGASEVEFNVRTDTTFRQRLGIAPDELLFLTVGSFTVAKGHGDLAQAYLTADFHGKPSVLLINANAYRPDGKISITGATAKADEWKAVPSQLRRSDGPDHRLREDNHLLHVWRKLARLIGLRPSPNRIVNFEQDFADLVAAIQRQRANKRVLLADLPRAELVQAYMQADLFVFASQIEYSPLVLFESAAAGTPFLSAQVGNADEIAQWTGAGVIGPSTISERGYTRINAVKFGERWAQLVEDRERLRELGKAGRRNWAAQFTWEKIAQQYEEVFEHLRAAA
jgi:L-malate glycosyltransferase